ncbi:MAG: dipeptide/oligopeptide/nickel ABC transporter permease/ATP-binding protein, partial [Candidatus Puniceispirillaceae bacterium]
LWGTRLSLAVGLTAALIAALIGSLIGIFAGFLGGKLDDLLMRSVDVLMAFPYILLALAIVAVLGPGLMNALIAVAIVNIPFFARNVRGVTLVIARSDYIAAARLSGRGSISLLLFEVVPNLWSVIIVAFSTTVGWMILETAGLSFLGLGSQPPQSDLGSMLGEGRAALITNPHTSVIPGLMIFVIVMGINLLGDGVRDALDPRLAKGALQRSSPVTQVLRTDQPAPVDTQSTLDVAGLSTEFRVEKNPLRAVRDVTFTLDAGECLAIVGESGSGKSVTALSITGLVASPPAVITSGTVGFQGRALFSAPFEVLQDLRGRRIAYIFQDPLSTLHPLLTVGAQLAEAMVTHDPRLTKPVLRRTAISLLEEVRIANPEHIMMSYPHALSGGMRQRIGIAMALANDPDIIIADEPTTALDVTVQAQVLRILDDLRRKKGVGLIFISHDLNVVSQISDRIAVMYAGQIVECGPSCDVLEQPAHPYTRALLASSPQIGAGGGLPKPIGGGLPRPDDLPAGCAFAARCEMATDICFSSAVELRGNTTREVRCVKWEAENG